MPQVSYSTAGFGKLSLEPALDSIAAAGFRCVEIACDYHVPGDHPSEQASEVCRLLQSSGLTATTVHAPARRTVLGAPTEAWRVEKVQHLADAVQFTGAIGAKGLVIHGIPNPMFLPDDCDMRSLYQPMIDAMRRSVADLVPEAAAAGIRLLLENLPYNWDLRAAGEQCDYPLMHMADLRAFANDFPADHVGLIVDVGHSWTNKVDPPTEIRDAGERLWGTHLQDVDFDDPRDNHWAPLQGGLDWQSILTALQDVDYQGTYTFETVMPQSGETPDELARLSFAAAREWGIV